MKFVQWKTRLLLIFLTILIHFSISSNGFETHEFFEPSSTHQIYDTKTYKDGTALLHMIEGSVTNCYNAELYFRLIYSNGTLNYLNIPAKEIPRSNFCQVINDAVYQPYIKIWPLEPNFIYVTYINSTNALNASVYGLLIDWHGKILSNSFISRATIGLNGTIFPPGPLYYSKENRDNGFLYVGKQNATDTSDLIWSYYTFPTIQNKYSIRLLRKGVIKNDGAKFMKFYGFSQFKNGFYLILSKLFDHPNVKSFDLANVNLRIETYFISSQAKDVIPNIIYQSPTPNLNVTSIACGLDYSGGGTSCLLYLTTGRNLNNLYALRIMFRSTGSTGVVEQVPAANVAGAHGMNLRSLDSGGYLITAHHGRSGNQLIYGYFLNATGHLASDWTLPQPTSITARGQAYDIFPNNTLVAVTQNSSHIFSIVTSESPKIPTKGDVGYFNSLIVSTYPPLNGSLPVRATEINITYAAPVVLSSRNITIYGINRETGLPLLRQTYSASTGLVKLSKDNKTIAISVFKSTFNRPTSIYHIKVDSDVVRLKNTSEPVLGIQNNVWNVTTGNITAGYVSDTGSVGFVRLTPEGTKKFNALDEKGKKNFTNKLGKELAFMVPVTEKRINSLGRYQKDQRTKEKRMLLAYKISPTNNTAITNNAATNNATNATIIATNNAAAAGEPSEDIVNDLHSLIRHGGLLALANLEYSKNLDSSYGFVRKRDVFRDNKVQLILFSAYLISLVLLILMIFCFNRQAEIGVVLKFIIALVTFVFYVLFVYENSRDVEILTIACVLLLIVPFIIKLSLGFFIISRESKAYTVYQNWIDDHTMIASFFIFLSGVDLDTITVLSSRIEESFDAPISEGTAKFIDVLECVGFFFKDLLQLAILVLYFKWTIDYGVVPFFALVSLIILIVYVIIWRLLRVCAWCCRGDPRDIPGGPSTSSSTARNSQDDTTIKDVKNESNESGGGASSIISRISSCFSNGLFRIFRIFRREREIKPIYIVTENSDGDGTTVVKRVSGGDGTTIVKRVRDGDGTTIVKKVSGGDGTTIVKKVGGSTDQDVEDEEEQVVTTQYIDEQGNPIEVDEHGNPIGSFEVDEQGNPIITQVADEQGNPISK